MSTESHFALAYTGIIDPHTKGSFFDRFSVMGADRVAISFHKHKDNLCMFGYVRLTYPKHKQDVQVTDFHIRPASFHGCLIETDDGVKTWISYLKRIDPFLFINFIPEIPNIVYKHPFPLVTKLADSFISARQKRDRNGDFASPPPVFDPTIEFFEVKNEPIHTIPCESALVSRSGTRVDTAITAVQ